MSFGNELGINEYTRLGRFRFETAKNMETYFTEFKKSKFVKLAIVDISLQGIDPFYCSVEDYSYYILMNYIRGHRLFLKRSDDGDFIEVYSMNYQKVLQENTVKMKKKKR